MAFNDLSLKQKNMTISIIIPALNEQRIINDLIQQIRNDWGRNNYEIIVVDGDQGGATIRSVIDRDVIKLTAEKGRAKQMNAGANIAKSDILLFLHADTILPSNAEEKIYKAMENPEVVAGAFELGIDSSSRLIQMIAALARIRTRKTRIPYGDQAIFIRRGYFENIGQFKDISVMEDYELMRMIKKRKDNVCILKQRVMTSPRRWEKEGIFYTLLRNIVLLNLYRLGIKPKKLSRYYRNA